MESPVRNMRVKLRVDACNDRVISGKHSDIHQGTRAGVRGYYISLLYSSARKFHIELAKCGRLGEITQEGDTEAVVFISRSVAPANAKILRRTIHARRIKEMSSEAKIAGAERLRIYREAALATEAVRTPQMIEKGKTAPQPLHETHRSKLAPTLKLGKAIQNKTGKEKLTCGKE